MRGLGVDVERRVRDLLERAEIGAGLAFTSFQLSLLSRLSRDRIGNTLHDLSLAQPFLPSQMRLPFGRQVVRGESGSLAG